MKSLKYILLTLIVSGAGMSGLARAEGIRVHTGHEDGPVYTVEYRDHRRYGPEYRHRRHHGERHHYQPRRHYRPHYRPYVPKARWHRHDRHHHHYYLDLGRLLRDF